MIITAIAEAAALGLALALALAMAMVLDCLGQKSSRIIQQHERQGSTIYSGAQSLMRWYHSAETTVFNTLGLV